MEPGSPDAGNYEPPAHLVGSQPMLDVLCTALNEHAIVSVIYDCGRITNVNTRFCDVTGLTVEELIGQECGPFDGNLNPPAFVADVWATIRHGNVWRGESPIRSKAGAILHTTTTIVPIGDAGQAPTQYVVAHTEVHERTTWEETLREGEQRFRTLAESLPQLIWTCQGDGPCDYLSPQWVAYTGIPEQDQLGYRWLEQLHPDDRAHVQQRWAAVAPKGLAFDIEFRIRRHDGAYRWFKTRATPIREAGRGVAKWFGSNTDIQDLRDAEDALLQANRALEARVRERTEALESATERMRLATAGAGVGVWDWNIRENELSWDAVMFPLYGVEPGSFGGAFEAWRSAVHPDDLPQVDRDLNDALAGRRPFDTSFRVIHPTTGTVRHLRGAAVVQTDTTGQPVRMLGVNWDVTDQRHAEQALQASERLLREFVTHAPAAIAMLDRNMRYIQASERWLQDFKLSGQNIIGRNHYEVFPDIPNRWKEIHQQVLAGAICRCDEDPFTRADGSLDWLQWEARPWLTPTGEVGGLLLFIQAITARKQLETDLQLQKEALERSNAELKQFAYVASHDLQEPLRAVAGCSQILQRRYAGQLDGKADDLIRHIVDGSDRMHQLIQDLLAYSRVDRQRLEPTPTDADEALRLALANLRAAISESAAIVSHDPLPILPADRSQLVQLFQNLVGNALKYRSVDPPRIHISALRKDAVWEFRVRDNGIGIETRYFERIFNLFQRLHTRSEHPGTGIGLAICRKIVQRHSGRIWVEPAPERGSVFCFTLPVLQTTPS